MVSPTVSMDELKEKIVTNVNKNKLVIEEKSNDIDYTEIEDNVLKTGVTIKYGNQIICTIIVKGDTNRDGVADIRDLLEINKHRLGKVLLTGESLLAGDINQDGQVDLHDLLQLNKYRLGKIDTL